MANIGLDFWLTQWNWEPSILIGTLLIVGLYLCAIGPLRRRYYPDEQVKTGQTVSFLLGMLFIFLALVSPLDELGDSYLFSAHMVQHLVLTIVGPPLLVIGTPAWFLKPIVRNKLAFRTAYAFGILTGWLVCSPSKDLPRLSIGGQVLYLFLSGMPSVLLGAGLTFSPPLYAPYIAAPRVWGISAATDQQLGGLIMWVPVSISYIVVMSVLFIRWMQQQEAKQLAEEREAYEKEEAGDGAVMS